MSGLDGVKVALLICAALTDEKLRLLSPIVAAYVRAHAF